MRIGLRRRQPAAADQIAAIVRHCEQALPTPHLAASLSGTADEEKTSRIVPTAPPFSGRGDDVTASAGPAPQRPSPGGSIEVGFLNLLPDAALGSGERQVVDLLRATSGPRRLRLRFFTLPVIARGGRCPRPPSPPPAMPTSRRPTGSMACSSPAPNRAPPASPMSRSGRSSRAWSIGRARTRARRSGRASPPMRPCSASTASRGNRSMPSASACFPWSRSVRRRIALARPVDARAAPA